MAGTGSTRRTGNTGAQEDFISGLQTSGALAENSGFEGRFGTGESNQQYSDRLDAWKGKQGGAGAGGGGGPMGALAAAAPGGDGQAPGQSTIGADGGGGGPVDLPAVNAIRPGLGSRIPPELYSALAGLKRIY